LLEKESVHLIKNSYGHFKVESATPAGMRIGGTIGVMVKKNIARLTGEERERPKAMVTRDRTKAPTIRRAQVRLNVDGMVI
jgi:hypothetical protein